MISADLAKYHEEEGFPVCYFYLARDCAQIVLIKVLVQDDQVVISQEGELSLYKTGFSNYVKGFFVKEKLSQIRSIK